MRLFKLLTLSIFALTLASLGAGRWVLTSDTPSPLVKLLLPDSTCPAPCWNGINTNAMNHQDTVDRILSLPHAKPNGLLEWDFALDGVTWQHVRLDNGRDLILTPQGLRWGDVLAYLGSPDYHRRGGAYEVSTGSSYDYLQFVFLDERYIVIVPLVGRLSPALWVRLIYYPTRPFNEFDAGQAWEGFTHYADQGSFAPYLTLE